MKSRSRAASLGHRFWCQSPPVEGPRLGLSPRTEICPIRSELCGDTLLCTVADQAQLLYNNQSECAKPANQDSAFRLIRNVEFGTSQLHTVGPISILGRKFLWKQQPPSQQSPLPLPPEAGFLGLQTAHLIKCFSHFGPGHWSLSPAGSRGGDRPLPPWGPSTVYTERARGPSHS